MQILDCTLRDGGYKYNFDFSDEFVNDYLNLISAIDVYYVELGYYQQGGNPYFNLNNELIRKFPTTVKTSVMIDHWIWKKNIDINKLSNIPVDLVRVSVREDDIRGGIEFCEQVKRICGCKVSCNLIHITEYDFDKIKNACDLVSNTNIDIIYFADSYGNLNLKHDSHLFQYVGDMPQRVGFHLHSNTGLDVVNLYECDESNVVDFIDTTIGGLGKGAGNLPLENLSKHWENVLFFINKHKFPHRYNLRHFITGKLNLHVKDMDGLNLEEFYYEVKKSVVN